MLERYDRKVKTQTFVMFQGLADVFSISAGRFFLSVICLNPLLGPSRLRPL